MQMVVSQRTKSTISIFPYGGVTVGLNLKRKFSMKPMFHRLCSPLVFGWGMIAGCWIGIVCVLVVCGASDSKSKPSSGCLVGDTISTDCTVPTVPAEKPVPLSDNLNDATRRKPAKVLQEMDVRSPLPTHEAFPREYRSTKQE